MGRCVGRVLQGTAHAKAMGKDHPEWDGSSRSSERLVRVQEGGVKDGRGREVGGWGGVEREKHDRSEKSCSPAVGLTS